MSGYIHIYAPQATDRSIRAGECPDCKRRTRFMGFFTPWYGWDSTCLRCGRSWSDGEWLPLNFERAARSKSVASAKRRWRRMAATPPAECDLSGRTGSEAYTAEGNAPWDTQNPPHQEASDHG